MDTYKHILVAIDLSDSSKAVVLRAKQLAEGQQSKLSLIHVIEPVVSLPGQEMFPSIPIEFEQIMQERAENFLIRLEKTYNLNLTHRLVRMGSIKGELFKLVDEIETDLIVLGTHGRHGIGLLLGSTSTTVLHGTPCDVLSVRIQV